jgi:hypothetical protein
MLSDVFFPTPIFQPLAVPLELDAESIDRPSVPAAQSAWLPNPMYFGPQSGL